MNSENKKTKKNCLKCRFLVVKKYSKRDDTYGYCSKLNMPMLAVQENCKYQEDVV